MSERSAEESPRRAMAARSNQEQAAIPQLVVDFDRAAMARRGLSSADLSDTVEALFQGRPVGDIV
ncbi:MAG: hypothetical protein AAFX50_16015, partial [Acidobacteriota bacterium]